MSLTKEKSDRILNGPILKSMMAFALPLILTSVLQQMYNTADTLIVGMAGGKDALSAVGATGSIINLCVTMFVNLFAGTNILVARYTGEKNDNALRKVVSTTYIISLALGAFLLVFGEIVARKFLILTECPVEILDSATKYLTIYFIGVPGSMLTNFAASVIRNYGDSRSPFIYLSVSGALNVLFNILFVTILDDPVAAVAWATVLSIYAGTALFLNHIIRMKGATKLSPFKFSFDREIFVKTLRLGIPTTIANACFAITNIIIQPVVNSFGTDGLSGMSAASSIENYAFLICGAMATTTAVFMGQNMGAGNGHRVKDVLIKSYLFITVVTTVLPLLLLSVAKPLLGLFIPGEETAIEFGYLRMKICLSATIFQGFLNIGSGALQAHGRTTLLMIANLVGVCLFRITWMLFIYPLNPSPKNFLICYPVSWAFCAVFFLIASIILTKKYMKNTRCDIVTVKE